MPSCRGWLALKHDDEQGGNWVGCVACHAYAQERPHTARPNIYAHVSIGAAKLLGTKAAVLLRHAKTRLRLQAVASLLGVPCGGQAYVHYIECNNLCTDALARLCLTRMRVGCCRRPGKRPPDFRLHCPPWRSRPTLFTELKC